MPVMTDYLHALEGRLRIKVPEVKGSPAAAARIEGELKAAFGVEEVHANPLTGNVLITYQPEIISQDEIIRLLKEDLGFFREGLNTVISRTGPRDSMAATLGRAVFESALQTLVMAII